MGVGDRNATKHPTKQDSTSLTTKNYLAIDQQVIWASFKNSLCISFLICTKALRIYFKGLSERLSPCIQNVEHTSIQWVFSHLKQGTNSVCLFLHKKGRMKADNGNRSPRKRTSNEQ